MIRVKLTKIRDNRFHGKHPKAINLGHVVKGIEFGPPILGLSYFIDLDLGKGTFWTSVIQEIKGDELITMNSVYKREVLEEI